MTKKKWIESFFLPFLSVPSNIHAVVSAVPFMNKHTREWERKVSFLLLKFFFLHNFFFVHQFFFPSRTFNVYCVPDDESAHFLYAFQQFDDTRCEGGREAEGEGKGKKVRDIKKCYECIYMLKCVLLSIFIFFYFFLLTCMDLIKSMKIA